MQNYPPAISCQQPRHLHRAYAHDQACDSLELDMQQYPCPGLPQVSANTSRCHCCSVLAVTVSLTYAESDLHARYDFRLNWPDRARHLSLPRYTHPPTMTCSGPKHNYSKEARPLHKREREREREFTPFQPHRADAGAARTSPGRSHKRVSIIV